MYRNIMHVSFFVKDMDTMRKFYEEKLGAVVKMAIKYKAYLDRPDSTFYEKALKTPEEYCIIYFEIAPGQFVEFFPYDEKQSEHVSFNSQIGYSHFGILVDDIFKTRDELVSRGVEIDSGPSIGNSHTWQMWIHDPEDNHIEFMQYTDDSYQLTGHID